MLLPNFITSRSTHFGFAMVILLCGALVWMLFMQIDTWTRAGFELIKNNTQQAQLVLTMRDVVQKRQMSIQRMINMQDIFDRDNEATRFYSMAATYADTREKLLYETRIDDALRKRLQQLDEAVSYTQPYQNNLIETLVFDDISKPEVEAILKEGLKASEKVLILLDKIVESQSYSYQKIIADYERSRQYTLLGVVVVFILVMGIVAFVIRTSSRQFKQISRLSIIDEVSGIYNRRYFDMVLEEEWKRSMRESTQLSLLMLDIDYFKAYNDTFGHQMGDACLFSIAKILSSQLKRASDFTARYGGEEFVIVLPNTNHEHAHLLAERLRRSVESARIKSGNDSVSSWVTVSIGVVTAVAEYGQEPSVLVNAADSCLYESKHRGRNRVTEKRIEKFE